MTNVIVGLGSRPSRLGQCDTAVVLQQLDGGSCRVSTFYSEMLIILLLSRWCEMHASCVSVHAAGPLIAALYAALSGTPPASVSSSKSNTSCDFAGKQDLTCRTRIRWVSYADHNKLSYRVLWIAPGDVVEARTRIHPDMSSRSSRRLGRYRRTSSTAVTRNVAALFLDLSSRAIEIFTTWRHAAAHRRSHLESRD